MTFKFKLPDIGEGIQEGEIVRWIKKEGDSVKEDEPLVEVMTDKATVELTSPRKGKLAKCHFKEGDMAKVGDVILEIDESGGGSTSASSAATAVQQQSASKLAAPEKEAKEEKTLFDLPKDIAAATKVISRKGAAPGHASTPGHSPAPMTPSASGGAASKGSATSAPAGSAPAAAAPATSTTSGTSVATDRKATAAPAVRRYAREKGINLQEVPASGPNGRVLREDVDKFTPGTAPAPTHRDAGQPTGTRFSYTDVRYSSDPTLEERIPLRGLRRTISKAMERSKFTATHFTYVAEVDCDKLVALRDASKRIAEERGVKLSFLPFIAKAAVAALKRHPEVNAVYDENSGEVIRKRYYHIGIATATSNGLIVPVVRDADKKGILAIAAEIHDLSERTRSGKAKPEELSGSTFSITSLGKLGGVMATPILNYPEVAIMGIHEMQEVPVVKDGKIVIGWRMNLSFSFDHRIVDGYNGAMFANTLLQYLEDPQLLLLETL